MLNKEYELSLWEDFMDNSKEESFINERKVCVLASNTLDNPRAAYNIVFKSKVDGTHELTFDMMYRYWDQQEQDFIDNPLIKHLYNEAKVKLCYKGNWYDFAIKNCEESSKEKQFSYTCQDIFLDELGRNGYSVEFDTELGGNVGTITDLAVKALEDSDWIVDVANCDRPLQKISEPVYAYTTTGAIAAQEINDDGTMGDTITVPAQSTIFICYTCAHNEEMKGIDYQFYFEPAGVYETDDDSNFINTKNKCLIGENRFQYTQNTHTFVNDYRGYRYVRAQKTQWLEKIGRQVSLYNIGGKELYGYTETTYLTPKLAQNVLINSSDFSSTSGWTAESSSITSDIYTTIRGGFANADGQVILETEAKYRTNSNVLAGYYYINDEQQDATDLTFYNRAFKNNAKTIGALTSGDEWVVRVKKSKTGDTITPVLDSEFFIRFTPYPEVVVNDDSGTYDYYYYKVIKSCSYNDMITEKGPTIGFASSAGYLLGAEMFRLYTFENDNGENELLLPETDITLQNLIQNKYYYFTQEQYDSCNDEDDLEMENVSDEEPSKDSIVYYENFEKIATIEEKESNYFNIIQTLCEKFECWADFRIQHETNGATLVDDNGRRIKQVVFKNYIGKDNWAGFKYGINLDSIQRTVDSSEITTKIIVKANSNEFAENGSCNIANSSMNYPRTQYILNFDYFTHQGVLDDNELSNDLYVEGRGYLGFYEKTRKLNVALQELEEKIVGLEANILQAETTIQSSNVGEEDFEGDIYNVNEKLKDQLITFGDVNTSSITVEPYKPIGENAIFKKKSTSEPWGTEWEYETKITFYNIVDEETTEITEKYKSVSASSSAVGYLNEGKTLVDNYNQFIKDRYEATIAKDNASIEKAKLEAKRDSEAEYEDSEGTVHTFTEEEPILPQLEELNKTFYSKYSRFLREGTWTDEDYTDADLYYLDACGVAHTSAFPKTTYTISVADIASAIIPEDLGYDFTNYDFACGDLTIIEDTEFFGWGKNGMPYRERVLVSETEEHLDKVADNKITIQNYKIQFDDLFQRISAATQSLELKQGQYDKASEVVNLNGEINPTFLQNTLLDNSLIIQNSGAQSVQWGSNGIITTDENPMYQTRIIGGGIVISEDGGATWNTGISGKGINASMIKAGQLDTGKIRILNGNDLAFSWDSNGINGYYTDLGYYDYSKYTRHDKFGFYAVEGIIDYAPKSTDEIWQNESVPYCLTAKGLRIGKLSDVPEDRRNDSVVIAGDMFATGGKIGNWNIGKYDIQYANPDDPNLSFKAWMSARTDGKDYLHFGTGSTNDSFSGFRVDSDGKLWANGADISGTIKSTDGLIGGLTIQGESLQYWASNSTGIGIYGTTSQNNIAIAVGRKYLDTGDISTSHYSILNAPFRVYHDGTMHAEAGTIGGWNLDKNGFWKNQDGVATIRLQAPETINEGTPIFYITTGEEPTETDWKGTIFGVQGNGKMYCKNAEIVGKITATSGTFSGTIEATSIIQVQNDLDNETAGTQIGGLYYYNSESGSRKVRVITTSRFSTYYNGHNEASFIVEKPQGVSGNILRLRASACYNQSGEETETDCETNITLKGGRGTLGGIYDSYGRAYVWNYGESEIATKSDISDSRLKHSVSVLSEKYEKFFDKINPVSFVYNKNNTYRIGDSQRTHLGFIADEVENALVDCELTTNDFAGYRIENKDGYRSLVYSEFIALNTWQIQKLKSRIKELEEKIENLT